MIFTNGLNDIIEKDPSYMLGVKIPDELKALRGDVGFILFLSEELKGRKVDTKEELLDIVSALFKRLTGEELRSVSKAYSREIFDLG